MSCEAPFLPFLASSWRIGFLCICSYLTRPPLVPPRHMGAEGPLWSPPGPRPIRTLHATFAFPSHRGRRCRYSCRASRYPEPGRGAGETSPQLSSAPLNPSPSLPSSFLPLPLPPFSFATLSAGSALYPSLPSSSSSPTRRQKSCPLPPPCWPFRPRPPPFPSAAWLGALPAAALPRGKAELKMREGCREQDYKAMNNTSV